MVFKFIGFFLLLIAVGFPLFYKYAMSECEAFKIPDQTGKLFVITGANSGLGFYTSLDIVRAGGSVVMAVRSLTKGQQAKQSILEEVPNAIIDVMEMDLASFDSIRLFAETLKDKYGYLDVLCNNADYLPYNLGIMAVETRQLTKDGLESQVGANHFGHFLLTSLLLPLIRKNGRIVNNAASLHAILANYDSVKNDFQSEKSYNPWVAYGNSKAANILFTYELNRRLQENNPNNIIAVAHHPGYTSTNLQNNLKIPIDSYNIIPYTVDDFNYLFAMPTRYGSYSQTLACCGENINASYRDYIGPRFVLFGAPRLGSTAQYTWNEELMSYLWKISEEITRSKFLS